MNKMRKLTTPTAAQEKLRAATPRTEPRTELRSGSRAGSRAGGRLPFRTRLFLMLLLFALIPTVGVTLLWAGAASRLLERTSSSSAWERMAASGEAALRAIAPAQLTADQRRALARHEAELRASVEQARRYDYVASRAMRLIAFGAVIAVVLVAVGASKVAGHLSRQLSRPVDELVGWTALIRTGGTLPTQGAPRGAPEFELLRNGMRTMAEAIAAGRQQAIEAERAAAFRESARRFAHELKNPLTPIRFAIARLRRSAPDDVQDTVDVLAEESARLEAMARSFAQFGRLPDGPPAELDIAELVTRVAQNTVPEWLTLTVHCEPDLPLARGFHEPLVRAVSNVLLNAVDACAPDDTIGIRVQTEGPMIAIAIADSGRGIAPEVQPHIFDPYVTTKPAGTGLGLAIARQTIQAHQGTIAVESTVGQGTTMTIRLPRVIGES